MCCDEQHSPDVREADALKQFRVPAISREDGSIEGQTYDDVCQDDQQQMLQRFFGVALEEKGKRWARSSSRIVGRRMIDEAIEQTNWWWGGSEADRCCRIVYICRCEMASLVHISEERTGDALLSLFSFRIFSFILAVFHITREYGVCPYYIQESRLRNSCMNLSLRNKYFVRDLSVIHIIISGSYFECPKINATLLKCFYCFSPETRNIIIVARNTHTRTNDALYA